VLFKPLCDSHRVDDLLDQVRTPSAGRAIWAFRDVDGRARSAVAKFGRNNLLVLHDIVSGNGQSMWQAQRLSPVVLSTLRDFDYTDMSPHTAAALFWWARNSLFFDLALDQRSDVLLASYGDLVGNPRAAMQVICDFLGFAFRPALVAHIAPRRATPVRPLDIDSRVRTLCDELQEQLDRVIQHQHQGRAA